MELLIAFVAGIIVVLMVAEDPRLEDLTDKELVNRMADESRKGWNQRRRRAYTKAGWKA